MHYTVCSPILANKHYSSHIVLFLLVKKDICKTVDMGEMEGKTNLKYACA